MPGFYRRATSSKDDISSLALFAISYDIWYIFANANAASQNHRLDIKIFPVSVQIPENLNSFDL